MNRPLFASVSAAALLAMSSIAIAQGPDRREPAPAGPSSGGSAPQGREQQNPAQQKSTGGERRGGDTQRGQSSSEQRQGGDKGERNETLKSEQQRRGAEGERPRAVQKSEEKQQRARDLDDAGAKHWPERSATKKGKAEDSTEQKERRSQKQEDQRDPSAGPADRDAKGKAAGKTGTKGENGPAASDARQRDKGITAAPAPGASPTPPSGKAAGATENERNRSGGDRDNRRNGRLDLTIEQRSRFRETVGRTRSAPVTNVNVEIRVGERLPRRIRLYAIPTVLVSTVPEYRRYRYALIRDEICIVDPATYEIIEVIDSREAPGESASVRESRGQATVRPSDRSDLNIGRGESTRIYRLISERYRQADVRFRLALGAEIPSTVELLEFPTEVIQIEPRLRNYRFVFAEDQLLVVEPRARDVVLLLRE